LWFVDAGMAAVALLYAAVDAGLGACFFGVFDHEAALRAAFAVPDHIRLAGTVAIGHPDSTQDRPSRSALRSRRDDVVRFDAWE
jgi:nitroreductase